MFDDVVSGLIARSFKQAVFLLKGTIFIPLTPRIKGYTRFVQKFFLLPVKHTFRGIPFYSTSNDILKSPNLNKQFYDPRKSAIVKYLDYRTL